MNAVLGIGLSIGLAFMISACSKAADVQLRGPEKPKAPTGEVSTPAEVGESETEQPKPPVAVAPAYRLFCHDRYFSYLTVVSSKASASGAGSDLDLQVVPANRPLPVTGGFEARDRNLELHMFPQPIEIRRDPIKGTETRVVFSARPIDRTHSIWVSRNIYVSDVILEDRVGRATQLAPEMAPSPYVESLGDQEGVSVETFGVSDEGKFLFVLGSNGISLYDSKTLRRLGEVKWKLSSRRQYSEYFAPSLRESDMTLAVSHVDAKLQVTTEVFEISLNSRGEVQLGARVLEVSNLRRPLVSASSDGPRSERTFYALTGGKTNPSTAEIVVADPAQVTGGRVIKASSVRNFRVPSFPTSGRVPSAMVLWKDVSGETLAVLGLEDFEKVDGVFGAGYKIKAASFHTMVLDEARGLAGPVSNGAEAPYPQEVRSTIETVPLSSRLIGLKDIQFSPDRKAIFLLLPGGLSYQLYRMNALGADRISQEECSSLSIGVE